MTPPDGPSRTENPFSTRHIRPGALPYLFPSGCDARHLIERLRDQEWRGEIVGPHGSGKSSLIASLVPAAHEAGRKTLLLELHDGQRRLPVDLRRVDAPAGSMLVIVDGYEQLSAWNRWRLRRLCRQRGLGILVTSHTATGLPRLFSTSVDASLAQAVVRLLLDGRPELTDADELARLPGATRRRLARGAL